MRYHGESNPYNVEALWEVRLRPEILEQIQIAARKYGKTMSWVVRFCVFELFRTEQNIQKMHEMADMLREKNQITPMRSSELHRMRVCLYGDDERIFLELKYRYRLTTTMLVRIALVLYLSQLLKALVSPRDFFYCGLKYFKRTKIRYSVKSGYPIVDFHFKQFFSREDFWNIPDGPIPEWLEH